MKNMTICHDFRYGKIMYNTLDKFIGESLKLYGEYCKGEADIFSMIVQPGDCVIEGGANIGSHTIHLAQLVGDEGVVYAFEPQRLVFQLLAGNIAINGLTNVYCEHKALSDNFGTIKVPVLDNTKVHNWGGVSLEHTTQGEDVEVITLDSLNLQRCDFIKLDVEGMELNVLKGARELIRKFQPIIYAEANPPQPGDKENKRIPLFEWLRKNFGYHIYNHTPLLYSSENYFGNPVNVFANIASINVLCLPPGCTRFAPYNVKETYE